MNIKTKISSLTLGITSIITQIILVRELLTIFYCNELSIGIILASWLFWVGIGSSVSGKFIDGLKNKESFLSYIHISIGAFIPLNIFIIRYLKNLLKIPPGEIIGLIPMAVSSFLCLSIISILFGVQFNMLSKIASKNSSSSKDISKLYLLESLGASIGGVIFSFFLIKTLSPFQAILVLSAINILASFILSKNIINAFSMLIISIIFIFNFPAIFENNTRSLQFKQLN